MRLYVGRRGKDRLAAGECARSQNALSAAAARQPFTYHVLANHVLPEVFVRACTRSQAGGVLLVVAFYSPAPFFGWPTRCSFCVEQQAYSAGYPFATMGFYSQLQHLLAGEPLEVRASHVLLKVCQ